MINAKDVRYIKLGPKGIWVDSALAHGELHFGYGRVTHELAVEADAKKIKLHLVNLGRDQQAAARDAQEVIDFYHLGEDCLWITFANDRLWWAFAKPEVVWLTEGLKPTGIRIRKTIDGWHDTDLNGQPLIMDGLSTKLTRVAAYRRTICRVKESDYLLRRINGIEDPIVARNLNARNSLIDTLQDCIASLHWKDFETLIDIIFSRSGWNRISPLGGSQKTVDLELEQVITNELAAVQVKSVASQKTLDDYIMRIDEAERFDRFFFVCHSPKGEITAPPERSDVNVWTGKELAATILKMGLHDWVLEKVA